MAEQRWRRIENYEEAVDVMREMRHLHGRTLNLLEQAEASGDSSATFQTRLTNAAKEPPNFAGHYRITYWGCGSFCSAGAVIDLQTGYVFPPPLAKLNGSGWERWIMCTASFEGSNDDFRIDSRLMIVRCGMNFSVRLQKNVPDTYYLVWENDHFRQILRVPGNSSKQ